MEIFAGTSGFSYKEWKGSFYPEKLPSTEMLRYYAERLSAVELNNTFYRMPRTHVLENWLEQVGTDFRFSVKASRRITHIKRLKNVEDEIEYLLSKLATLGPQLGVVCFNCLRVHERTWSVCRLSSICCPRGRPRPSSSGMKAGSTTRSSMPSKRATSLCVSPTTTTTTAALISTADWGYLRLRKASYSDADLAEWAGRIDREGWARTYVFFKHEDEAGGPALAARFVELASRG